jgi:hypothetical protein
MRLDEFEYENMHHNSPIYTRHVGISFSDPTRVRVLAVYRDKYCQLSAGRFTRSYALPFR